MLQFGLTRFFKIDLNDLLIYKSRGVIMSIGNLWALLILQLGCSYLSELTIDSYYVNARTKLINGGKNETNHF